MAEAQDSRGAVSLREETIRMVRALLIPHKKGVLLSVFLKLYREFNGRDLPYAEMGFGQPLALLLSLREAVSVIHLTTRDVILTPVASEKSAHLRELVVGQSDSKSHNSRTLDNALRFQSCAVKAAVNKVTRNVACVQSASSKPPLLPTAPDNRRTSPSLPQSQNQPLRTGKVAEQTVRSPLKIPVPVPQPVLSQVVSKPPDETHQSGLEPSCRSLTRNEFRSEIIALLKLFPDGIYLANLTTEIRRRHGSMPFFKPMGCSRLSEFLLIYPDDFKLAELGRELYLSLRHSTTEPVQERQVEAAAPLRPIMDTLKKELYELLRVYPNGLWCYAIEKCYRDKYGHELNPALYGFRNVTDLVSHMPDVITMIRPAELSDFLLFERSLAPPPGFKIKLEEDESVQQKSVPTVPFHIKERIRKMLRFYHGGIVYGKLYSAYLAFTGEQFEPSKYGFDNDYSFLVAIKGDIVDLVRHPEKGAMIMLARNPKLDVLPPLPKRLLEMNYVPRSDIAHKEDRLSFAVLEENFTDGSEWHPIKLGEVYTPVKFWFYLDTFDDELDRLDCKMTEFYNRLESVDYKIPFEGLCEGLLVAAKCPTDGVWYRCLVRELKTFGKVELLCLDYGTPISVPVNQVYGLHRQFLSLPVFCLRGALDNLRPYPPATSFSKNSVKRFMQLVFNKSLACKVVCTSISKVGEKIFQVVLCDTNGDDDVFITDALCNEQLAFAPDPSDGTVSPFPLCSSPSLSQVSFSSTSSSQVQETVKGPTSLPSPKKPETGVSSGTGTTDSRLSKDLLQKALENLSVSQPSRVAPASHTAFTLPSSLSSSQPKPSQWDVLLEQLAQKNTYSMPAYASNPPFSNFGMLIGQNVAMTPEMMRLYQMMSACQAPAPSLNNFQSLSTVKPTPSQPETLAHPPKPSPPPETVTYATNSDSGVVADQRASESDDDISWLGIVRSVKPVELVPGTKIHIVNLRDTAYLTSAEFSNLIPKFGKKDLVQTTLKTKKVEADTFVAERNLHDFLFEELEKYNVPGLKDYQGISKDSVVLYEMAKVPQLLTVICNNVHNDPHLMAVWRAVQQQVQAFRPDDSYWNECKE